MFKIVSTKEDKLYYGFGLSGRNIEKLKAGRAILIDLAELGGDGVVMIFYGSTERQMLRDFERFIGPETKVNIDPRLKD